MSFGAPLWLLALAVVPLAVAAVVWTRRHRRARYAVRFPAVAVLREAGARVPGWERHLPSALVLGAAALLAVALARPQITYRAAVGRTSIVLVSDHSGSMAADDVAPSRLAAAIRAANTFADQLPSTVWLGAVTFSTSPDGVQQPVANHAPARSVIDEQTADGGTDTGDALALALQLLRGATPNHPPSAIVLLSDGAANAGPNPVTIAQEARREHIPIDTVALGTANGVLNAGPFGTPLAVPPDPQLMQQIATVSGGRAFNANTADQLSSIYKSLGSHLGTVARRREITVWFAVGGAVLVLIAGVASARWWGQLP